MMPKVLQKIWRKKEAVQARVTTALSAIRLRAFCASEEGSNLIEYALIAALIGLIIVVVAPNLRTAIEGVFTRIANALTAAPA